MNILFNICKIKSSMINIRTHHRTEGMVEALKFTYCNSKNAINKDHIGYFY